MKRLIIGLMAWAVALGAFGKSYRLEGSVGGQYPIIIELEEHDDGLFSGRYAYKLTLKKNGEGECSWLDINPSYENPYSAWDVRDCTPNLVETWRNVKFSDRKHLSATMKNNRGKTYTISANVVSTPSANASLTPYFKSHIGECVEDFGMWRQQQVFKRLDKLMPNGNYDLMRSFYQVQTPIEYTGGMFWASGFKAHQCCDPAVLWAYDSTANAFYVWVRKDDQNYWWSETGQIPPKFQQLVSENF